MIRRRQQGQRDVRRARKRARAALGREDGDYKAPPRDECVEKPLFYLPLDDRNTARVCVRMWRQGGLMADFYLELQVATAAGDWDTRLRLDICHGHAHAHQVIDGKDVPRDPQHVYRVDSIDDVDEAYRRCTHHCIQRAEFGIRHQGR